MVTYYFLRALSAVTNDDNDTAITAIKLKREWPARFSCLFSFALLFFQSSLLIIILSNREGILMALAWKGRPVWLLCCSCPASHTCSVCCRSQEASTVWGARASASTSKLREVRSINIKEKEGNRPIRGGAANASISCLYYLLFLSPTHHLVISCPLLLASCTAVNQGVGRMLLKTMWLTSECWGQVVEFRQ